jgi:hypothetical protein
MFPIVTGETSGAVEGDAGDDQGSGDGDAAGDGDSGGSGDGDATTQSGDGDGDSTTGGDGTAGDGDGDGVQPCIEDTIQGTVVPWNVMLVLDYSSSMQSSVGLFGPSRWSVLWDAVDYVTTNYDDRINMGAMLFPDMSITQGNSCVTAEVEVPVMPLNGGTIMSTIPASSADPPGNTPTRDGLLVAAAHLQALPDQSVPQAIILVTDGEALCPEGMWAELSDDLVDDTAASLYAQGIPTYVIGMSNLSSSAQSQLNEVAVAGGVPNTGGPQQYYSASDLAQLQAAFDTIGSDVLSCVVELQYPPPDPSYLEIEVDGVAYSFVSDCTAGPGWTFVPGSMNQQVELCGTACDVFKTGAALDVTQACPPPG